MTKLFSLVLMTLLFSSVLAADASQLEEPAIPIGRVFVFVYADGKVEHTLGE